MEASNPIFCLFFPNRCPNKNLAEFTENFDSMHDATNKIRKLEDQLRQAEKEKEELQMQVNGLQTIVNDLEKKLYTKQSAEGGAGQEEEEEEEQEQESEAEVVVGLTTQETDRLVRLQNCLQSSIDACQHLQVENEELKEENKTLKAEKKELEKNVKELQSKIDNQSPTAAAAGGGKKSKTSKDVSHLVNEVVAKDIHAQVKFVFCRNCKFVHTKKRMLSLGKAVWEWVKKKHKLNETTYEDFIEVYEASIQGGVGANRMYVQQQTQKAARGE